MELSTKFASAWLISSRLPFDRRGRVGFHLQRYSFFLRQRLIKFADIVSDLGGIEFAHVLARLAGFRACDHQQRIEGTNQPIRFLDRAFQRGAVFGLIFA